MWQKLKAWFEKAPAQAVPSVAHFSRNRFSWLKLPESLKTASRRAVDEAGNYADNGAVIELEFADGPDEFDFLYYVKSGQEEKFADLLATLNDLDNALQTFLERQAGEPTPQFAQELGYSTEGWEQTFHFHPWILDCENGVPSLRYVADHVNDEFTVYFAKREGNWQAFWDEAFEKRIENP